MSLVRPEEQARKLGIVESGIKTEFWKTIVQQVQVNNFSDMQEVIDLHRIGKHEEAKILSLQVKARQEFIQEPGNIIRHVKPKFFDFKDGQWIRKIKQIFERETSRETQTY